MGNEMDDLKRVQYMGERSYEQRGEKHRPVGMHLVSQPAGTD